MTELEKQIVDEALSWKGTRWVHGQACKGVGVDCIQLLVVIYKKVGLINQQYKTIKYNQDWALHNTMSKMLEVIKQHCHQVSYSDLKIGDIIVYKYGQCESHTAMYIGNNDIIHSLIRIGVVQSYLSDFKNKLKSVWRLNSICQMQVK